MVAVEPQEQCCHQLKKEFGNRITIVPKGLGEIEDVKQFFISDDSTLSPFSGDWINFVKWTKRFKGKKWNKVTNVEITMLDKLIKEFGKPAFI